jgi:hypothetical protein
MAALSRAARTAIVSFAGFAIGQWVVGKVQVAVFATFTGLALLGIADFGGTMRGRCGAIAGAAVTGFALAALGTWASSPPVWADAVVTAVAGAGIVTIALLGGYLTAGASAVTLFYLIAVGSPPPVSVIDQRLAGIAVGPVTRILTPGQHGDCPQFIPLPEQLRIARRGKGRPRTRPGRAMADKAYSSAANRAYLRRRGIQAVIPVKEDQKKHRRARGRAGGGHLPSTPRGTRSATPSSGASASSNSSAPSPPGTTSASSCTRPPSTSPRSGSGCEIPSHDPCNASWRPG